MFADGRWSQLTLALGTRPYESVHLGPWSDNAVRMLWVEPVGTTFQVCTQSVDTTSLALTGPVSCGSVQTRPSFLGDAVNGNIDDFQFVFAPVEGRGSQVWRFVNGALVSRDFITADSVFQTPRSVGMCVLPFAGGNTLMRVSEGKAAETLFNSALALLGCGFEVPVQRTPFLRVVKRRYTVEHGTRHTSAVG